MVTHAQLKLPGWLSGQYPFSPYERRTTGGAVMRFLDEGPRTREAVLMVHGNPTWSFYYRRVVQALAGDRRCVVPDHIGMGLSEKPAGYPYRLAQRIQDIEELVAELKLERVHLVVHDWGGAIGLGWAGRHPEMVGNIAILNTAAYRSERMPFRIGVCRWPVVGKVLVQGLNGFAGPATWMAMSRRAMTADEKKGYLYPYGTWADRVAVHGFVKDIPMEAGHPSYAALCEVEEGLRNLKGKKATVFWGAEDFCFDQSFYESWKRFLPQAEYRWLDGVGHYVLEDGGETVIRQVAEAV